VMTWPERKGWMDGWAFALRDRLGIKYCARSPPGVMPWQGINTNPGCMWLYSKHSHNKPALRQTLESFSRVVKFFERVHRSVDLRKYRQPCIMSSITRWI
jgi:hypothetical protein